MSIGQTGSRGHPDVRKAEQKTIETALKLGIHPRIEIGDAEQAAPYIEMGVKHFCIGWDVRILADWWDTKGAEMHKLLNAISKEVAARTAAPKSRPAKVRGNYS